MAKAKNLHPIEQLKRDLLIKVGVRVLNIDVELLSDWFGLSRSAIYKIDSATVIPSMEVADVIESVK